jgi:hypothetical protein
MFKLKESKIVRYDLEMNDREHGALSLALRSTGFPDEDDWTKSELEETITDAILSYTPGEEDDALMDVYTPDGDDMDMKGKEYFDILCKFNNFVQTLPEKSEVHINWSSDI